MQENIKTFQPLPKLVTIRGPQRRKRRIQIDTEGYLCINIPPLLFFESDSFFGDADIRILNFRLLLVDNREMQEIIGVKV
jgi:hypothetical protein